MVGRYETHIWSRLSAMAMIKPTICHLGAWGKNWGDRAIQYALQNAVGREDYEWWNVDVQQTSWHDKLMWSMTPENLVLIGGGGLLWDKAELKSPSGWQWQISPAALGDIDAPIIVHAIGDTRFPYGDDRTGRKPEFKESLQILAEKAISFSVRDELTQRILADMDIETTLCPDPALFIGEPREKAPDGPPILGVCLAWDKAPWRWLGKYQGAATFVEYMDALAEALRGFVEQGWQLRPFCHIPADGPTVGFCTGVLDKAGKVPELPADSVWWFEQGDIFKTIPRLANMYSECTAVVSMRKHGIIIPAGLGVPVVGLGDLAEVGSICKQLGVEVVTSETASPETFTEAINNAVATPLDPYLHDAQMGLLRAKHDRHIARIRRALV